MALSFEYKVPLSSFHICAVIHDNLCDRTIKSDLDSIRNSCNVFIDNDCHGDIGTLSLILDFSLTFKAQYIGYFLEIFLGICSAYFVISFLGVYETLLLSFHSRLMWLFGISFPDVLCNCFVDVLCDFLAHFIGSPPSISVYPRQ